MSDIRRQLKQLEDDLSAFMPDLEPVTDAERGLGELLKEREKNPGGQREHETYQSHDVTGRPPTLEDLGIHRMQSSRFQRIADVPEPEFERHIEETKADGKELAAWVPGDEWADLDYQQHEEFFTRLRAMPGYDRLTESETVHV